MFWNTHTKRQAANNNDLPPIILWDLNCGGKFQIDRIVQCVTFSLEQSDLIVQMIYLVLDLFHSLAFVALCQSFSAHICGDECVPIAIVLVSDHASQIGVMKLFGLVGHSADGSVVFEFHIMCGAIVCSERVYSVACWFARVVVHNDDVVNF